MRCDLTSSFTIGRFITRYLTSRLMDLPAKKARAREDYSF